MSNDSPVQMLEAQLGRRRIPSTSAAMRPTRRHRDPRSQIRSERRDFIIDDEPPNRSLPFLAPETPSISLVYC